jgi:hypothetical protein
MLDVASIDEMQSYLVDNPEVASLLSGIAMPHTLPDELHARPLHYNKPQLKVALIGANETTCIWGRGTGKSEGVIAPKTMRNMEVMPRSRGSFVGRTYLQLLERTLPPVIKGWESQGYVRGKDFWVREKPPKHLNIPTPIVGPLTSEHTLYHRNGSVASMISQDRPGSANGTSLHWIAGDEAKLLDKQKYDNELMPANRGDERYWKDVPELHGIILASDMPTSKEALWLLDKKAEMQVERIELILSIQHDIFRLTKKLIYAQGLTRKNVLRELSRRRAQWDKIRANTNFYSLASTLDNLEGFGKKNLARLKRILPAFIFMTAILNHEPFLTESAFYPDLGEAHLYDAIDYAYVDSVDWENTSFNDCRKDADLNPGMPLHMGADYNASINPIVIGQAWRKKDLKVVNSMYVKHPERLSDAATKFCDYYQYHRSKRLYYYYDHTAIATTTQSSESPADEFCRICRERGWDVEMVYLHHTAAPEYRYELSGRALRGGDENTSEVIFNRSNNEYLLTSLRMAKTYQKERGFAKDKKDEKKKELDQRETTHFSDAYDTLLVGFNRFNGQDTDMGFDVITT